MDLERLYRDIDIAEGLRLRAYPDPASPLGKEWAKPAAKRCAGWEKLSGDPWTIGRGHTGPEVHPGSVCTVEQADEWRAADVQEAIEECDRHIPWWRHLNEPRQRAVVELMFNMGWLSKDGKHGFGTFKNTLRRLEAGQYMNAAAGLANSLWAKQVKSRAQRIIRQIRDGL
jgi:lysozyme